MADRKYYEDAGYGEGRSSKRYSNKQGSNHGYGNNKGEGKGWGSKKNYYAPKTRHESSEDVAFVAKKSSNAVEKVVVDPQTCKKETLEEIATFSGEKMITAEIGNQVVYTVDNLGQLIPLAQKVGDLGSSSPDNAFINLNNVCYEEDENIIAELTLLLFESASKIELADETINQVKQTAVEVDQKPKEAEGKPKQRKNAEEEKNQAQQKEAPQANLRGETGVDSKKEKKPKKEKQEKKPKPEPKKVDKVFEWISKDFYGIYHKKRFLLDLHIQLSELWDEIYETVEDEGEIYDYLQRTKPNFFTSFAVFSGLLFHCLVEKQLYEHALDFFYQHDQMMYNDQNFGQLVDAAVGELEKKGFKGKSYHAKNKGRKVINEDKAKLAALGRKIEDLHLIEKFDKSGKRFIRIGALEKLKKEDKIAIHYEMNPHQREYFSTVQIATKTEVFILDFEKLCRFEDNIQTLTDFFTVLLGKRSGVIILMNAKDFCKKLVDSLFVEKERENKEYTEKKKELCKSLDRFYSYYTDMSKLGMGTKTRDLFANVLNIKLNERPRFGDWFKRPLSEEQIELAAMEASGLFDSYEKLFESDQSNPSQVQGSGDE